MSLAAGPGERAARAPSAGFLAADELVLGVDIGTSSSKGVLVSPGGDIVASPTAYGVRHNVEAFRAAGAPILRAVAVGGGTTGGLWTQIVSDVTGLVQELHVHSIGACYGAAMLAAAAGGVCTDEWNPVAGAVVPQPAVAADYELFGLYRRLYDTTADTIHALASLQRRVSRKDAHEQLPVP